MRVELTVPLDLRSYVNIRSPKLVERQNQKSNDNHQNGPVVQTFHLSKVAFCNHSQFHLAERYGL
jgi:hypothetical protein